MKSSFSRIFFPVIAILLSALMLVGLFSQFQVRFVMEERSLDRLESNARTLSDLAAGYVKDESLELQDFLVTLAVATKTSQADAVLCDTEGKLLLCADTPLGCEHQGYMMDKTYLRRVFSEGMVRSTGKIQGLYPDSRYVVSAAIQDDAGQAIGLVVVSSPVSDSLTFLRRFSSIYLMISVLVVLIAALVVWFYVRRQSIPLRNMARTASAFGHGDLEARVQVSQSSPEEIRKLAIAFNNMAASLQKSEYMRQEFVANVSHELKTPMTTISGFVDGILDGTIPPDRHTHYLSMVSDETKRLSRLVRSMLDISKMQESGIPEEKKTRFDLLEAAGQVLITFEQKILQKQLQVKVDFPELPLYALASADAITQVIYNLVDNAVKFCPQGGQLELRIRQTGQKAYVSVSNEGDTIPPQELPLVFDRFHKLDKSRSRSQEGWGLGLYIVKTLVCSHGENISVSSQNGVTEFTFTLPVVN